MTLQKYIKCKMVAYQKMGIARKNASHLCTLFELYSNLSQMHKYAIALDTIDYMFGSESFAKWYFSEYAQITIDSLQDLFRVFIASVDRPEWIRVVYKVERAIEKCRWVLKDQEGAELDFATMQALHSAQREYKKLQPVFIHIMKCWFEAQN